MDEDIPYPCHIIILHSPESVSQNYQMAEFNTARDLRNPPRLRWLWYDAKRLLLLAVHWRRFCRIMDRLNISYETIVTAFYGIPVPKNSKGGGVVPRLLDGFRVK